MPTMLLLLGLASLSAENAGAVVTGVVIYDGPAPPPIRMIEAQTWRHIVERDPKTNGLKDAVAWLEGPTIRHDAQLGRDAEPAEMDQAQYFFVPHVLAIRAAQRVVFHNSDAANHAIMATSLLPQNSFNVITPTAGTYGHRFVRDPRPVAIRCPIHPEMGAWIFVFDHPYYSVTDKAGRFRIEEVPAGDYTLRVRHPSGRMSASQKLTVGPGQPAGLRICLEEPPRSGAGK